MSGAFFSDFSVLGVLWWMLGFTLATVGRYNAAGSGSGRPLGAEREPMASFSEREDHLTRQKEMGFGSPGEG